MPLSKCSGCGLEIAGGREGCQALFDELLARQFADQEYSRLHRLMVDAYCLQHAEEYCASAKSLMAHLGGACCAFEHGNEPGVHQSLLRSLNGAPAIERPPTPVFRGGITIADLSSVFDPDSYLHTIEKWARSVWESYAALHPFARQWIEKAISTQPPGSVKNTSETSR